MNFKTILSISAKKEAEILKEICKQFGVGRYGFFTPFSAP
jgi:hypothetical protein